MNNGYANTRLLLNLIVFVFHAYKSECYICASYSSNFLLLSVKRAEERLNIVSAMLEDRNLHQVLEEEVLRHIPDFYRLAKKFHRRYASLQVDCSDMDFFVMWLSMTFIMVVL